MATYGLFVHLFEHFRPRQVSKLFQLKFEEAHGGKQDVVDFHTRHLHGSQSFYNNQSARLLLVLPQPDPTPPPHQAVFLTGNCIYVFCLFSSGFACRASSSLPLTVMAVVDSVCTLPSFFLLKVCHGLMPTKYAHHLHQY